MMTLALLPVIVQVVIMLVNGNIGTGVAVMGAFSLVRFRSVPGSAMDICAIFLSMAVGLATGTNHLALALMLAVCVSLLNIIYTLLPIGKRSRVTRILVSLSLKALITLRYLTIYLKNIFQNVSLFR